MKKLFKNKKTEIILLLIFIAYPLISSIVLRNPKYILKIGVFILIYIIAVSGLDILYGYCGQISMGHAGFFAIGAYGSALINDYFHLPIFVSMILAAVISCIVAALVAYPASQLKFHFLSLATIAFGEIIYVLIQASPNGITGDFKGYFPKTLKIFNIDFSRNYILFYFLVLIILIILIMIKQNIVNSKLGRGFTAIRENVIAANGMGINVMLYKVLAFCISAIYVSIAGSLYAHFVNYISPGLFSYDQSVSLITMLLFGGAGNLVGPVVGVAVIQLANELFRNFENYQMLFYGILILIVVLFMPNGIVGIKDQILKITKRKEK